MKNLIFLLVFFSSAVALGQDAPTFWVKGKCYPTVPFGYVLNQKLEGDLYGAVVTQTNYCLMGISCNAVIELKGYTGGKGRVNTQVEYLGTKLMKLDSGFETKVDFLRECR